VAEQSSQRVDYALTFPDGKEYSIQPDPLTMGREADCDLVITDPLVSRRHAEIQLRDGTPYITDLGSVNGTWVNGQQIGAERALQGGDVIEVGDTKLGVRARTRPISISVRAATPEDTEKIDVSQASGPAPAVEAGPDAGQKEGAVAAESAPSPPARPPSAIAESPGPPPLVPPPSDADARLVVQASQPVATPGGLSARIALRGVLDIETADVFRDTVKRLLEAQVVHFAIGLDELEYVDSSGLGALVALHREVKPRSGQVELHHPQPAVRSVIELTRLDRVFKVV
jgi:anti-anti-sigma factor